MTILPCLICGIPSVRAGQGGKCNRCQAAAHKRNYGNRRYRAARKTLERKFRPGNTLCVLCGLRIAAGELSAEHSTAIRHQNPGGQLDHALMPAHKRCNYSKRDRQGRPEPSRAPRETTHHA